MRKACALRDVAIAMLGFTAFVVAMIDSFHLHNSAFVHCFSPIIAVNQAEHSAFSVVAACISILLLAFVGYRLSAQLPHLAYQGKSHQLMLDTSDLDLSL